MLGCVGFPVSRALRRRADIVPVAETKVVRRRVLAHLLDWLIVGLLWIAISIFSIDVAVALGVSPDDYWQSFGGWYDAAGLFVLVGVNWLILQALTGYSLGKVLLGIRVVDEAGRAPGLLPALKRTVPLVIEQLGLVALWAMRSHPRNQRFGDRWAHTYVVRARSRPAEPTEIGQPKQADGVEIPASEQTAAA